MSMDRYEESEEMNDADELEVEEGDELAFLPQEIVKIVKKALMSGEDAEAAVKSALQSRPKPEFRITGEKPSAAPEIPRIDHEEDLGIKPYESAEQRAQRDADDLERKRYEENRWADSVAHHGATAPLNEYKPKERLGNKVVDPQAEKRAKYEAEQRKQEEYESRIKLKPYER
jgi:hypothetical protein